MKSVSAEKRAGNEGFAMLFVLFLMALVVIGSSVAVLDRLTEGRREKEAEMIWRGKQYQRAIGMYYRKLGRFPTSVDDLVKVQNGELRFLREAYKNPMNKEDGTWRFIYVTPAGQLIGSVQYVSLQQMAFLDQQRQMGLGTGAATGTPVGTDASTGTSDTSGNAAGAQSGTNPANANLPNGSPANPQTAPQPQGQNPQQPGGSSFFSQPLQAQPGTSASGGIGVQESSGSSDSTDSNGEVIGGFIIGVAGKQDKPSIKVYKGGATYKRWEFIFNPLEQVQTIGTTLIGPQTNPAGTLPNGQPQIPNQPPQQQPQVPQQPQIPQQPQ